jgi:hypothetical protein
MSIIPYIWEAEIARTWSEASPGKENKLPRLFLTEQAKNEDGLL